MQAVLARIGGDLWRSWRCLALWPWPAVVVGYPKFRFSWDDYRIFTRRLLPGDFILTASEPYFLSNRGIRGSAFKHLAIYTGAVAGFRDTQGSHITKPRTLGVKYGHTGRAPLGVHERTVTHAVSDGVICQDLGELLFHTDWACAVRPWDTQEEQRALVRCALSQVGIGYDFAFKPGDTKEFFCTELGVFCARKIAALMPETIGMNVDWKGLILPLKRFRRDIAIADAFFLAYAPVCCSLSCADPEFVKASTWPDEMRLKLLRTRDAAG